MPAFSPTSSCSYETLTVSASFSAAKVAIFISLSACAQALSLSSSYILFAASTSIFVTATSVSLTICSFSLKATLVMPVISLIPMASNLFVGSISSTGVWFSIVMVTVSSARPFSSRSSMTTSLTPSANFCLSFCRSSRSIVAATDLRAPSTLSSSRDLMFSSIRSFSASFPPGLGGAARLRPMLKALLSSLTGTVLSPSVWAALITFSSSGFTFT